MTIIPNENIIISDNIQDQSSDRRPITNAKADTLIHPIRLRILLAIASSQATAQQIAVYLPDVAPATLYRHIRAMSEAGILQVVEERPIRGATERVYAIAVDKVQLSPEEVAALTPEDHERLFSTFTAMLLSQFHNYIQQPEGDLIRDGVRCHTAPLYLSDAEHEETMRQIDEILKIRLTNTASPERRRRLLSLIIMPDVHSE